MPKTHFLGCSEGMNLKEVWSCALVQGSLFCFQTALDKCPGQPAKFFVSNLVALALKRCSGEELLTTELNFSEEIKELNKI